MDKKINIQIKEHGSVLRTEGMIGFNEYMDCFKLLLCSFLKKFESARDKDFLNKLFNDLIKTSLEDIKEDESRFN